jgi:hypothetical protein
VTRNIIHLLVAGLLVLATLLYVRWNTDQVRHGAVAQEITCVNNLKQTGLAFRTWSIDHDGLFPFNASTNAGGSRELCAVGSDGFDANAALHFQALANGTELVAPRFLICPKDRVKKPAPSFSQLKPENLTYRLRTGTSISETNPKEVLLVCPIDGNRLYCDGSVASTSNSDAEWPDHAMHIPAP